MSGLNYLKLGSTLSNICNTAQLDNATKCHHAFKNFWGESCITILGIGLKHRPLSRTISGSHSSYVKHQEDFTSPYKPM